MSTKAESASLQPVTILHNPRCSKSRAALELLRSRASETRVIEYLRDPPSPELLSEIIQKLDAPPRDLIRPREQSAAGLPTTDVADEIIDQICASPQILQRPIVVVGDRACIARPAERLLELFD